MRIILSPCLIVRIEDLIVISVITIKITTL